MHFLFLSLIFGFTEAFKYERSFNFKKDQKPPGGGRLKPLLKKILYLKSVPTLPPIPTLRPHRLLLNNDETNFDPCKIVNLCVNGGSCVSDGNGDYFCNCPPDYYGKTCQFYADATYCFRNNCANNATCYSVADPQKVINPELADYVSKGDNTLPFPDVTVVIRYQCWCQYGFYGPFCEFSEELRHCAAETCSGHGIVNIAASGDVTNCQCHCEPYYSGKRCEIVSPCRDFECTNNGECKLTPAGTPFCSCPKGAFSPGLGPVHVSGLQCEMLEIADSLKDDQTKCLPCSGNFMNWFNCLVNSTNTRFSENSGATLLSFLLGDCAASDSNCTQQLQTVNCLNLGECTVALEKIPSVAAKIGRYFLVPKCLCKDGFEGNLCERKVPGPCDETVEEIAAGIKKCIHGTCAFNRNTGLRCICQPGWHGTKCDQKDPCHVNPCGDALCVIVPDGSTAPKHICVCNMDQDVDSSSLKCITPHHESCFHPETKNPFCENSAHCYPCESDSDNTVSLCTDIEQKRGFRCICPPGFVPPFCSKHADACTEHQCLHGGKCVLGLNGDTDYSCECIHGFTGSFCEQSPGPCATEGVETCVRGKCVEDTRSRRKFRCECDNGWKGFDCQKQEESNWILWIDKNYIWTYPTALGIVLIPIFLILYCVRNQNKVVSAAEHGIRFKPATPATSVQQDATIEKQPTISVETPGEEITAISPGDVPPVIPPNAIPRHVSNDRTTKGANGLSGESNEGIEQTAIGDTQKEVAVTQSGESGDAEKKPQRALSEKEKVAGTQSGDSGDAEKVKQKATVSGDSTKKGHKAAPGTESKKFKNKVKPQPLTTSSGETSKAFARSRKKGKIVAIKMSGTMSDNTTNKKKSKLRKKN